MFAMKFVKCWECDDVSLSANAEHHGVAARDAPFRTRKPGNSRACFCYQDFEVQETYPNPLQINLGEGRIAIEPFSDEDGYGIIFKDSGEPHEVGELTGSEPTEGHMPESGEIYLRCSNRESALVLMEQVCRVVAFFTDGES